MAAANNPAAVIRKPIPTKPVKDGKSLPRGSDGNRHFILGIICRKMSAFSQMFSAEKCVELLL